MGGHGAGTRLLKTMIGRLSGRYWRYTHGGQRTAWERTALMPAPRIGPDTDPRYAAAIEARSGQQEQEYIDVISGDLHIDPVTGMVIVKDRLLQERSLPYHQYLPRPNVAQWWSRMGRRFDIDRCISLRTAFETNHFHFFNDLLCKIPLLERANMLCHPVVIGAAVAKTAFYQEIAPSLRDLGMEIIIQDDRFIRAKEIVYCKAMPLDRGHFDRVLEIMHVPDPKPDQDRLFITRGRNAKNRRNVTGLQDLVRVAEDLGFVAIDPGELRPRDQIEVFGKARLLAGIHGAGLTNMIFRRNAPMDVLEILPSNEIPPHYHWLASICGHGHRALLGGPMRDGHFKVDPRELEKALLRLLNGAQQVVRPGHDQ